MENKQDLGKIISRQHTFDKLDKKGIVDFTLEDGSSASRITEIYHNHTETTCYVKSPTGENRVVESGRVLREIDGHLVEEEINEVWTPNGRLDYP